MITATSLKNPSYLARIKAAIIRAVEKAHKRDSGGFGYADVYNAKGRASLEIVAARGGLIIVWEECAELNQDVTALVMAALREYHAKPAPLPVPVVEFDSGPMPLTNVHLLAVCESFAVRPKLGMCV